LKPKPVSSARSSPATTPPAGPRTSAARNFSYAEVKAIASGNPAVLTLAEADAELQRLTLLKKNHLDEQYVARRSVRDLPGTIASMSDRLGKLAADHQTVTDHIDDPIIIEGRTYAFEVGDFRGGRCAPEKVGPVDEVVTDYTAVEVVCVCGTHAEVQRILADLKTAVPQLGDVRSRLKELSQSGPVARTMEFTSPTCEEAVLQFVLDCGGYAEGEASLTADEQYSRQSSGSTASSGCPAVNSGDAAADHFDSACRSCGRKGNRVTSCEDR
jgi:hypothetical protein